jgi:hypothetical protein
MDVELKKWEIKQIKKTFKIYDMPAKDVDNKKTIYIKKIVDDYFNT